jgi:hypothetical protein
VFAVFFLLYVYLMSSDSTYVCECSTLWIAHPRSLLHYFISLFTDRPVALPKPFRLA